MERFKKLGINEQVLRAIKEAGFEEPSEIQGKTIPLVLQGKDIIAGSATGSGKTLVFAAGIIQNIEAGNGVQALILTPTRELAEQVAKSLIKFSKYQPLRVSAVYGGVSIQPQIRELRYADVVVATPGRLLDCLERRALDLSRVKILVLDEADRMLDMGFMEDVSKIIKNCPEKRQTLLFSATISQDVFHIAKRYMKNPTEISAESYVGSEKLEQIYYCVEDNMKFSALVHLLKEEKSSLVMVFCNTRRTVDFVAKNLQKEGIRALAIHGGHTQARRDDVMRSFHSREVAVLVCTDVAARGLDIKNVSHVYNYDIPKTSKEYIHRIGRTARAGKEGKSISLISGRDYDNFRNVLKDSSIDIKEENLPEHINIIHIRAFHRTRTRRNFPKRSWNSNRNRRHSRRY